MNKRVLVGFGTESGSRMRMKTVTVLVGSGRKQRGLIYRAARQFLDNLESRGDSVRGEIVFLSEHELGLCRGCKVCFSRGEEHCPLRGDRDLLIEKMLASDGIVLASPNYSFQVSSTMKAFLDRLGYVFHRPIFFGKTFTSITRGRRARGPPTSEAANAEIQDANSDDGLSIPASLRLGPLGARDSPGNPCAATARRRRRFRAGGSAAARAPGERP